MMTFLSTLSSHDGIDPDSLKDILIELDFFISDLSMLGLPVRVYILLLYSSSSSLENREFLLSRLVNLSELGSKSGSLFGLYLSFLFLLF